MRCWSDLARSASRIIKTSRHAALAGLWLLIVSGGALAQTLSLEQLARHAGADRTKILIEGAKKEGIVHIYSGQPIEDMKALTDAFEKTYGVKSKTWRGSGEDVSRRAVTEAKAGRYEVDVFEMGGQEMEALQRETMLQAVKSPVLADLLPQAIRPHGEVIGTRLTVIVGMYNTNLIKKEDVPTSYAGFADPKWRGKLGVEADDQDWLATITADMGEEKGLAMFRDIGKVGVSVRRGHTLLANLVAAGEVPLALTVYSYKAEQLKKDGAPVELLWLPPVVARVSGIGVAKKAPHPYGAILFFDFMLGEGQKIMAERSFWPTNRKVKDVPTGVQLRFTDAAQMLDEREKWAGMFKTIFAGGK